MRVASVDIGTNTALLLIADVTEEGIIEVQQQQRVIRLGEGVDSSGIVSATALDRLGTSLQDFVSEIQRSGVERVVATGTSASRDAANKEEISRRVQSELGVPYQIISGRTEALLTFIASTEKHDEKLIIVDVGGGSTEVVYGEVGEGGARLMQSSSYQIGSVRLTERFLKQQPPLQSQIGAAIQEMESVFDDVRRRTPSHQLVAIGGTATTAAVLIRSYARAHLAEETEVAADELTGLQDKLASLSTDEILALHPEALAGRADVIFAGVAILNAVAVRTAVQSITIRNKGIRHASALLAADDGYRHNLEEILRSRGQLSDEPT